ncbi:MAG: hypothetical protein ACFCD0_25865 [Gemmataceae bacterium]
MPFSSYLEVAEKLLVTTVSGVVTDEELWAHQNKLLKNHIYEVPQFELVDTRSVESWQISSAGQCQLALIVQHFEEQMRGLRVAMVAKTQHIYGMFRMWELQRENLDYKVKVFRYYDQACQWLGVPSIRQQPHASCFSSTEL